MRILTILGVLLFTARPAEAGWYAKQVEKAEGRPAERISEMWYQDGKLRIDQALTSVIFDLRAGAFIALDHTSKSYLAQTLEEMLALRGRVLEGAKENKDKMTAEQKAQLEQLEATKAKKPQPKAEPTGKKDKIAGLACEVFKVPGEAEVCVAKQVPKDVTTFIADAKALMERAQKLGADDPGALGLLGAGVEGFPLRTRRVLWLGGVEVTTVSEVKELKTMKVPPDKLSVPSGYVKKEIPTSPGPISPGR